MTQPQPRAADHPLAGVARDASTIREVVDAFERDGFTTQFAAREGGEIECVACHHYIDPAIAGVDQFRRLEGASDPDDMLAIIAVTCPRCRAKGTLIVAYGPMSSAEDAAVLARLTSPPPPHPDAVRTAAGAQIESQRSSGGDPTRGEDDRSACTADRPDRNTR